MLWYHIRAKDTRIDKPNGMVVEFWMGSNSIEELNKFLKTENHIIEIEWIKQENPPFI